MSEENTIQPIQPNQDKLVKRTALVCKNMNEYMSLFLKDNKVLLESWISEEQQQKLRLLTNEKKVKCKKDEDSEEVKQMKQDRKERKKGEKEVKKKEKVENKLKGKPKSAFFYYMLDEKKKVLDEHPDWNKKEVHLEIQRRWKIDRLTDKLKHYTELADLTYKNMPVPVKKPFKPYDRDARKRGDDPKINKYNKNKYKDDSKFTPPKNIDMSPSKVPRIPSFMAKKTLNANARPFVPNFC